MKLPCPVNGCENYRPAEHAMCRPCWRAVPRPLQRDVYKAWRERQRGYPGARMRHLQAVENACASLEGRAPRDIDADLEQQLGPEPDPNEAASYGEHPLGGSW